MAPPPSNGGYCKFSSVVVSADIDKASIACEVIYAVGISTGKFWVWKVMTLNLDRLLGSKPLLAPIGVIADKFLLLGIHRYDGKPMFHGLAHRCIDVAKLSVTVRMVGTFLGLPIGALADRHRKS